MSDILSKSSNEAQSFYESWLFHQLHVFEAPQLTLGHKCMGFAALFGFIFIIAHMVTIIVTLVTVGANWGMPAWMADLTGYIAGALFAFLCRNGSNKHSSETAKESFWIFVWASITICVRILDVLMITGAVVIEAIYKTPHGPVLAANIFSEIIIAFPYTLLALVGSVLMVWYPQDEKGERGVSVQEMSTSNPITA